MKMHEGPPDIFEEGPEAIPTPREVRLVFEQLVAGLCPAIFFCTKQVPTLRLGQGRLGPEELSDHSIQRISDSMNSNETKHIMW